MNAQQLVTAAIADGLNLNLLPNGNLKIAGEEKVYQKWFHQIREQKSEIIPVLGSNQEFESLFSLIAIKAQWKQSDYLAWRNDFELTPEAVLECLRALHRSWTEGRYGWLIESDWVH